MGDVRTERRKLLLMKEAEMRSKRKKMGRMGPLKPTRMGKIEERPLMTRGMIERRKEMEKRNSRALPPAAGMLSGGQAKIAAKAPPFNKIDGKDFAVLRKEKAKGRGQGLQDEKLKPGKVTKAALGVLAAGLSAKKRMDEKKMAPVGIGGIGASMARLDAIKKILGKNKGGVMKANEGGMGEAKGYKKYLKGLKKAEGAQFRAKFKAKEIAKAGGKAALRAAKASRIGKIAAGVAAVGLGAKEFLKRKMEKNKNKPQKKMGGGMMMQRPIKAVGGAAISAIAAGAGTIGAAALRANKKLAEKKAKEKKKKMEKPKKKMGGGMMQRPMGYSKGTSVKVKCKLGRNKPTKMY